MHEHEARLERLEAERRDAPKPSRKLAIPTAALLVGAGPSRSGEIAVRVEGLAVGYLPGRGAIGAGRLAGHRAADRRARPVPGRPARGADRDRRAERRRQDDAAADDRGRPAAARWRDHVRERRPARLSRAAPRVPAIAGTTVLDALLEAIPVTAGEARGYLARFLFRGDDAFKEVRLAVGRGAVAARAGAAGIQPSNLLLLDEPTNHLDIPAREAIEAFMAGSPATLLVVSHDRRLLETVCEKLWVVEDGSAVAFDGGYREWRAAVAGGWTIEGALEQEAARLRGGRRAGAGHAPPALSGAAPNGAGSRARRRRARRRGRGPTTPPRQEE